MADMVLRVTPGVLCQKSGEFTGVVKEIQKRFARVEDIAARTKGYWQGEAGTQSRESLDSFQEDIQFVIRRLEEHPADLLTMAGIYAEAEQSVAETNAQLKTGLII